MPAVPVAFCNPMTAFPLFQKKHVGLSSRYTSITLVVSYKTICCVVVSLLQLKCGTSKKLTTTVLQGALPNTAKLISLPAPVNVMDGSMSWYAPFMELL